MVLTGRWPGEEEKTDLKTNKQTNKTFRDAHDWVGVEEDVSLGKKGKDTLKVWKNYNKASCYWKFPESTASIK